MHRLSSASFAQVALLRGAVSVHIIRVGTSAHPTSDAIGKFMRMAWCPGQVHADGVASRASSCRDAGAVGKRMRIAEAARQSSMNTG
jgi:hypothetical protein